MAQKGVMKTTVRNCTDKPLLLKEGNAGVYRTLTTLQAGKEYPISCNISATYREYWVGVRPDSTQSQEKEKEKDTPPQAPLVATITSDDCVAYRRLKIISSLANAGSLEVVYETPRKRGSTMVANRTSGPVTLETTDSDSNSTESVLQPDRKMAIQVDKHGPAHSVKVGDQTLRIDNKAAAKTQAVNIIIPQEATDAKLDMVPKDRLQTEVTNKTNTEVTVTVNGQDHTLQAKGKYIIAHDPKNKNPYCSVKCSGAQQPHPISSEDISNFECIDVESGASATEIVLNKRVPRSASNSTNVGLLSKVGSKLKGWSLW